jgi:hypothetical protein
VIGALFASLAVAGTSSLGVGAGLHDADRQLVIGLGPQLTHRAVVGETWMAGGGVERIRGAVPAWGLRGELGLCRTTGRWHPCASLELATWLGRFTYLTTESPTPPLLPPTSLRLRLRPLVFDVGAHSEVSALELAPGVGVEAPGASRAAGLTVFSVGHRW